MRAITELENIELRCSPPTLNFWLMGEIPKTNAQTSSSRPSIEADPEGWLNLFSRWKCANLQMQTDETAMK